MTSHHRSGFACVVGRPNAGKSTLLNALVGQKVAITSDRPQTTRHAVRGIVHRPDAQLIVVGTHGRRGFERMLVGSGAEQVIRLAPVPVLVIRGDAKA